MSTIIRVGDGQTPSGKILDRDTQWYLYEPETGHDERMAAICYATKTGKRIYVSKNNRKYNEISIGELLSYGKAEN